MSPKGLDILNQLSPEELRELYKTVKSYNYIVRGKKPEFMKVIQKAAGPLAALPTEEGAQVHKVLWFFIHNADWDNSIHTNQSAIGEHCKMDPRRVSHAIQKLIRMNIVRKGARSKNKTLYYLENDFAKKGSDENIEVTVEEVAKQQSSRKRKRRA